MTVAMMLRQLELELFANDPEVEKTIKKVVPIDEEWTSSDIYEEE